MEKILKSLDSKISTLNSLTEQNISVSKRTGAMFRLPQA